MCPAAYVFGRKTLAGAALALMLAISASAQTENILYSFTGSDGAFPLAGLTSDGKGSFYGTTLLGGASFGGTVFELTPNSNGTWTEKVLYSFTGSTGTTDGANPYANLVFDAKGNLYGTTSSGGASSNGTV